MGLFTWSGGPRSSGVSFFCFHALGDTKQKKLTPLDRGPPLHVNRVLFTFVEVKWPAWQIFFFYETLRLMLDIVVVASVS